MTHLFNRSQDQLKRKLLRNNQTEAERILWIRLRKSQLGEKFRRQYSVGPYVMDFYCARLKLGVEIDGDSHLTPEAQEYDICREDFLDCAGIKLIRVSNQEVYCHLYEVVEKILLQLSSVNAPPT